MNFIGIDYGEKRIGLSFGDDELRIAVPLKPILYTDEMNVFSILEDLIVKRKIDRIIIGYPVNMDDSIGFKAKEVDGFMARLKKIIDVPVERADERLTTVQAQEDLVSIGSKKSIKSLVKNRRSGAIDSTAAAIILQDYLNLLGSRKL
ncbi:MAG: Holliday junction resolvase RuvX [Puniceicoccales bacterium]|jgi:putative Holliday junction resolvase|nr:Holliday junction resolvase RuvX [Puniceicoccales bacterium]